MEDISFLFSYFGITLSSLLSTKTLVGVVGAVYYIMAAEDRKTSIF